MDARFESFISLLDKNVPTIVGAFAILVIGWIVSLLLASLVCGLSRRLGITKLLTEGKHTILKKDIWERWLSRLVFILSMILVFVGFFQVLGLTKVSEPLSSFLNQVFTYAPRLLGPAILLVIAWVIATVFRAAIKKFMLSSRLQERFKPIFGEKKETIEAVASGLGNTVYFLVFLFFFLAVLESLNLKGLLEPVQSMLSTALGFVPNLVAALAILLLGMFAAKLLKGLVANLITTSGIESLTEKAHLAPVLGKKKLSEFLSLLVYLLVMIPIIIAALNTLELEAITAPSSAMLAQILKALPIIFAATLVIIVAYYVGKVTGKILSSLLQDTGFDRLLYYVGLESEEQPAKIRPSAIVEYLVVIAIMFFASIEALNLLGFEAIGNLVTGFVVFSADVFLGLLIFGLGLFLANLAAKTILSSNVTKAKVLAVVSRVAILVFSGALALRQMKIAEEMITITFALIIAAIAIAVGISFGVGGREVASKLLDSTMRAFQEAPEDKSSVPLSTHTKEAHS